MRKLLCCLLITVLAVPAPVWAACNATSTDPADVNHCAFEKLKAQVMAADAAGVDVTQRDYDPTSKSYVNTVTHVAIKDLVDAQSNTGLAKGCNPVVWASLVQQARQKTLGEQHAADSMYKGIDDAGKNKCTTNVGKNGENRKSILEKVQDYLSKNAASLICSLNWSSLLGFSFNASLNICKGGKLYSAGADTSLQNSLNVNGEDPTKSKDCAQQKDVSKNLATETAGQFGTSAINGNGAQATFNSAGSLPPGSNGGGWTIGIGGSSTVNSGGAGSVLSGGISANNTATTTTTSNPTTTNTNTTSKQPANTSTGLVQSGKPPESTQGTAPNIYK